MLEFFAQLAQILANIFDTISGFIAIIGNSLSSFFTAIGNAGTTLSFIWATYPSFMLPIAGSCFTLGIFALVVKLFPFIG